MSAWIIGLAIAAGYLINKNVQAVERVTRAESAYQGAALPATGGVTTAEVRSAWRNTDFSTYGDFNSDLSKAERNRVLDREAEGTI